MESDWQVEMDGYGGYEITNHGKTVCRGISHLADARLIAASPALLVALADSVALADKKVEEFRSQGYEVTRTQEMTTIYAKCVRAIAKAAGTG